MRALLAAAALLPAALGARSAPAQSAPIRLTLEVRAPGLPDSLPIFLAGSHPAVGNWAPAGIRLTHEGNQLWRGSVQLPAAARLEFKFTLGSWEYEAADSSGAPWRNQVASIGRDTTIRATIRRWTRPNRPRVLNGQVTGTLRYHRGIAGAGLRARDVVVWLPPGYDTDRSQRYPVLYMFDGQNLFDPATSSFGTDWAIDESADSLIRAGVIPPLIVVGMNSSADRTEEYLPLSLAAKHAEFVIETVKSLIDTTYRTRPEAASTWVGGASAGGTAAFMLVWERPDVFTRALAFSPAFRTPPGMSLKFDYVPNIRRTTVPPRNVRLYFDDGGVGLDEQLRPGIDTTLAAVRAHGFRDDVDLRFIADPAAEHNEAAWRRRFPAALVWILR